MPHVTEHVITLHVCCEQDAAVAYDSYDMRAIAQAALITPILALPPQVTAIRFDEQHELLWAGEEAAVRQVWGVWELEISVGGVREEDWREGESRGWAVVGR